MTDWREVFERVPREKFAPPVVWAESDSGSWVRIDRDADPEEWARAVAADQPLVTQFDDGEAEGQGRPTSSLSMPTLVVQFLDLLGPAPRDRVLEIGTGSGWTAALLASVAGDEYVISVEVDPAALRSAVTVGCFSFLQTGPDPSQQPITTRTCHCRTTRDAMRPSAPGVRRPVLG